MTPNEKERIQAVQQMSRTAMVLANSATEFVMNESPIAHVDFAQKIELMEACTETAKKILGKHPKPQAAKVAEVTKPKAKPIPESPKVPSRRDSQEFIFKKEKVQIRKRFIECVWATDTMDTRVFAELESEDGRKVGKVVLTPNGFTLTTPKNNIESLKFIRVMDVKGIVRKVHAHLFSEE